MIGEQYAVERQAATVGVAARQRKPTRILRPPAIGVRHLPVALGDSTLVRLALAMTCVAVALLLYLAQASQVSVLEYNISGLQASQVQLQAENASLRATATQLQSFQRIDTAATTQLHMTKPDLSTAIWIDPVTSPKVHVQPLNADTMAAEHASQPLAWLRHAVQIIKSSL